MRPSSSVDHLTKSGNLSKPLTVFEDLQLTSHNHTRDHTFHEDCGSFTKKINLLIKSSVLFSRMAAMKLVFILSLATVLFVSARDPDLLTDFAVPPGVNVSTITGEFFKFTGLGNFSAAPGTFGSKKVTLVEFPALNGLGVGVTLLEYAPGTLNPPHTHPRGSELLYLQRGTLEVGLVDSNNKLYSSTIQKGDLFVFPQGLVHFQINSGKETASAISAFGSSNAGTISLPRNIFGSQIQEEVLLKAFKITVAELMVLEAPFKPTL